MLIDKELTFSDSQAITATANSTNVVDISAARNLGAGNGCSKLVIQVNETLDDAGDNSTITPSWVTASDEAFTSPTTIRTYTAIPANTVAGTRYIYDVESAAYLQYNKIVWTVANGDLTAGKVSAFLAEPDNVRNYASGFSIQ